MTWRKSRKEQATAWDGKLPNVDGKAPTQGESVLFSLLPHLQHMEMGTASATWYHPKFFQAPSDPTFAAVRENGNEIGDTSYVANAIAFKPGMSLQNGFADGQSNTLLFTHHYARCGFPGFSWGVTGTICIENGTKRQVPCDRPLYHRATFADAPMYTDVVPVTSGQLSQSRPSIPGLTFQVRPPIAQCDFRVPQALFDSGLLVVFADGSLRTFSPQVNELVFWGSVTPAGGEVLGDW